MVGFYDLPGKRRLRGHHLWNYTLREPEEKLQIVFRNQCAPVEICGTL
jgi:hypothetical protein